MQCHLWEEHTFQKLQNITLPSFKSVMEQIIDVYKNQRERIINQSNLIRKA